MKNLDIHKTFNIAIQWIFTSEQYVKNYLLYNKAYLKHIYMSIILTISSLPSRLTNESSPLHFQESTASESGSIENVSGNSTIPSVNPLGVPPVLSGSVETFPRTSANSSENDSRNGNRTSESSTNPNITVPEVMRNRAASTGSVLGGRRDSNAKGNDDHNRTMVFEVRNLKNYFVLTAIK